MDQRNSYVQMLFVDFSPCRLLTSTWPLNTGAPQGCVLSPPPFSLSTYDCTSTHSSVTTIKFVEDTTIIGCIADHDEAAYREEAGALTSWCKSQQPPAWCQQDQRADFGLWEASRTHPLTHRLPHCRYHPVSETAKLNVTECQYVSNDDAEWEGDIRQLNYIISCSLCAQSACQHFPSRGFPALSTTIPQMWRFMKVFLLFFPRHPSC